MSEATPNANPFDRSRSLSVAFMFIQPAPLRGTGLPSEPVDLAYEAAESENDAIARSVARLKMKHEDAKKEITELKAQMRLMEAETHRLKDEVGNLRTRLINTARPSLFAGDVSEALQSADFPHASLCVICGDLFHRPFVLTACGHSFCERDLYAWFNTIKHDYPEGTLYSCPMCRAMTNGVPVQNYALEGLINSFSRREAELIAMEDGNPCSWDNFPGL